MRKWGQGVADFSEVNTALLYLLPFFNYCECKTCKVCLWKRKSRSTEQWRRGLNFKKSEVKKKTSKHRTDAFWQRLVPVAFWLASEHRWAKKVISRVTVIEDHAAKGKVSMLNLTLPDGIGRNTGICAVYHWRKERKKNAVKPLLWFNPSHLETRRQLNSPHSIFIVARWFFFQHRQLLFSSWKLISIMVQRCIRRFPNPSREFCVVVLMYKNSKANIFFLPWLNGESNQTEQNSKREMFQSRRVIGLYNFLCITSTLRQGAQSWQSLKLCYLMN